MSSACVCHIDQTNCYYCKYELIKRQVIELGRKLELKEMERKNQAEAHNKTIQGYSNEITSLHVEMSKLRLQLKQVTSDHPVCGAIARTTNDFKFINITGSVNV